MLIGFTGKKLAGKDTAYRRLRQIFGERVRRVSFADKLYRSAAAALGVTVEQLDAWKTDPDVRIQIVRLPENGSGAYTGHPLILKSLGVRAYLQLYGTEAHRDIFGDNFWVDQLQDDFAKHDTDNSIVAVTDVRFPNEARRVLESGGTVVQVIGPDEVEFTRDAHVSESGLPAELIDGFLYNTVRDGDYARMDSTLRTMFGQEAE